MYLHTVFTQRNNVFLVTTLINHILKKSRGKNQREELFEIWRRREWDSSCSEFPFKVSHPSTKLYLLHFYNIMCFINVFQSFFVWNAGLELQRRISNWKKKTFILSKCPGLLSFLINLLSTPAQFLFLKKILNFYFICLKTFFGGPGIPETGEELFVAGSNWIQTALIPLLNRCFTVLH